MKYFFSFVLICTLIVSTTSYAGDTPEEQKSPPTKTEDWEMRSDHAEQWLFHDLPRHIGNDVKETVWSGESLLIAAGGTVTTLILHNYDPEIQSKFQSSHPFSKKFDDIMSIGFHPIVLGGLSLLTLGIAELTGAEKVAVTAGTLLEAFTLTEVVTLGLKYSIHRTRPDGSDSHSFPSAHTSGAFAMASVTEELYGPWAGIPAYALATVVGLSRLDSNTHFASDVATGALIGTLMGLGTAKFHKKEFSKYFLLVPAVNEDTAGISVIHPF